MKHIYRFVLLVFLISMASAQENRTLNEHFTRERTYDVLHYKLDLNINEKAKSCAGEISIKLVPLRPQVNVIQLDAADMTIEKVNLWRQSLEFHVTGETLSVLLDNYYGFNDTLDLVISYSVSSPKKGLYFVTPDSGYPGTPWQVWSQGEPEENHFWFPCYDYPNDKATSELIATVNEKFTVISNGKLIEEKHNPRNHTITYHWLENKPHSSYLISLVAGEYYEMKDSSDNVPVSYYVYNDQKDNVLRSFGKTPKMIEFFSTKIGYDYPWEKYSQTVVQDFIHRGMENVSATTLFDAVLHDGRAHLDYSSDDLVVHELAHQWWGNLVTFRDWSHAWLSEGFASYCEVLFKEFDKGLDEAMKNIYDNQNNIIATDVADHRRPTVCNQYINPNDLFDNRIYGKGACILHMLRFVLGDELFWKSMNHYVHKHAFQNVETNDLKIAIEEATGYNLQWFFDEWIYKPGFPDFEVKSSWIQSRHSVQVSVKQVQKIDSLTGIFKTPVDIEVWVNGVPETHRVMITRVEEEFSFPAYQQPQLVIFDKGNYLLKKVNHQKLIDEWIFQLQHARDGVDRLLAVDELRWIADSLKALEVLNKAMLEDRFGEVRRNAAFALGDVRKSSVSGRLILGYGDHDARVRTAIVSVLGSYKGDDVVKTLRYAFENDSSYAVAAGALVSLTKADSINAKKYCLEGMKRSSYRETIRAAAVRALAEIGDEDALQTILEFSRYGNDRSLRVECLWMLGQHWKTNEGVVTYLIKSLKDPSFRIRRAAIEILGMIDNQRASKPLEQIIEQETDDRLVKLARESISKLRQTHLGKD
jgi:aminopeptidase N